MTTTPLKDLRWHEDGPKEYAPRRKRIQVSKEGQKIAHEIAHIQHTANQRRGFQNRFGLEDHQGFRMHHIGALGKVAIHELYELDTAPLLINRDPKNYRDCDIEPNVWIRSAEGISKRLYLREDDDEHAEGLFCWAPVQSLEDGVVFFSGWVFGREGMKKYFWEKVRADRDPQFYVPGTALRSWATFKGELDGNGQGELF